MWRQEIAKGFDGAALVKAMIERGLIIPDDSGRPAMQKKIPNHGNKRVYALAPTLVEDKDGGDAGYSLLELDDYAYILGMAEGNGNQVLTDAAWAVWEPLIEQVRPRGKTPPKELRRTISAIFWRHQNGAKWRSIPAELGPWWLAAQLFIRWAKQGVWERLLDLVQQHDIALGMTFLDGTNIRAHHKAAGAQKRGSTATSEMCARRLAALAAAMAQKPV